MTWRLVAFAGWAAICAALGAAPANAITYTTLADEELVARSPLAAWVRVLSVTPRAAAQGLVFSSVRVEVLRALKGSSPESFEVMLPGGEVEGSAWVVPGAPLLSEGEEPILFMAPWKDGAYVLTELGLSKFDVLSDPAGRLFATRAMFLSGAFSARPALTGPPAAEAVRPLDEFLAFIERAGGVRADGSWTAVPGQSAAPSGPLGARSGRPGPLWVEYPVGGFPTRWNWSGGGSPTATVTYEPASGERNLDDGSDGIGHLTLAVDSWKSLAGVDIRTTEPAPGASGLIAIHIEDTSGGAFSPPCYAGPICPATTGGILGCSGPTVRPGDQIYDGRRYSTAVRAAAYLRAYSCPGTSSALFTHLVGHEFGHALGLGHSDQGISPKDEDQDPVSLKHCEATMRACAGFCGGGCGAVNNLRNPFVLGDDDKGAARYTYPPAGSSVFPTASFTMSTSVAAVGQAVLFTDTSSGSPASWLWTFGDGDASTSRNSQHAFMAAGTYVVSLRVSNGAGSETAQRTVSVSGGPGPLPVAAFTLTPRSPAANQVVSFTDTSAGGPHSWSWSFDDGTAATVQNPQHAFAAAGSYRVVLLVSNGLGISQAGQWVQVGPPAAAAGGLLVSRFAGSPGGVGFVDATGAAARLALPAGIAADASGTVYVADTYNQVIRKITPGGAATTLAGSAGVRGNDDGTGSAARFNYPSGVAVDAAGNVFVADTYNQTIRKITPAGVVTTPAGLALTAGSDNGTGTAARFFYPSGIAVDGPIVYIADSLNFTIRRMTGDGTVTTLAGFAGLDGSLDGSGSAARFSYPSGLAVDGQGNIFVADTDNHVIRRVTAAGAVTTPAGSAGLRGSDDGPGTVARFNFPMAVALEASGNVLVADSSNHLIRRMTPDGFVTTVAGTAGRAGSADGAGPAALFNRPSGIASGGGIAWVADRDNSLVRRIAADGAVTTFAGTGGAGDADGVGLAARFNTPRGLALDSDGNLYVADARNHTIRKISPQGTVSTLAGRPGFRGGGDGTGGAARFDSPFGVAVDRSGVVRVCDTNNHTVRAVSPSGAVTTIAGSAGAAGSADGAGADARFALPLGIAVDGAGSVYVTDSGNHTIRRIAPDGAVSTFAGSAGNAGSADGARLDARFRQPAGLALDGSGNLWVADSGNQTIRRIDALGSVTTVAGSAGVPGSADGPGSAARFRQPVAVAVGADGVAWVADAAYDTLRRIVPSGNGPIVTTAAGVPGLPGSSDGAGADARFAGPSGLAVGAGGAVFISDSGNHVIRVATPTDLLLLQGRISVRVEWLSQYTGQGGVAYPIPQKDTFGFFYFSNPDNPEVFVKVLDFGSGGALCFAGGLTDFFYRVTFTTLATGQTLVFEKPAGQYVGFADNGTLRFGRRGSLDALSPGEASAPQSLAFSRGRVSVAVEWKSQYSGETGTAFGIPEKDEFGFFYFTDPGNPEVFVKVLDFGSGTALCFVGGLTDFAYKVTFTSLRTGQTLVFEKPAGQYVGFADNGTLVF